MDECEKEDGPVIQAILHELGYVFTFEEACEFWRERSEETHSANWLVIGDGRDGWRERLKTSIRHYIEHKRAKAHQTLQTFPEEPKGGK